MQCKKCSKEIDPSFLFCPWCGRKINPTVTAKHNTTLRFKRPVENDFKLAREIYYTWCNDLFSPKYPNLAEYGKHEIGFSKQHMYNYRAVGEKFIDDNFQLRFIGGGDWNIEQVIILAKLSLDTVNNLIQNNVVNADMTCAQLKEITQTYRR